MLVCCSMRAFEHGFMDGILVEDTRNERWIQKKKALTRSFIPVRFNQRIVWKVRGIEHARLKPCDRRRRRWEGATKMDVEGRGCKDVN